MKSETYFTVNWKSPQLNLIDVSEKPKSKSRVTVKCGKCLILRTIIFGELLRTIKIHLKYSDSYLCPNCLRTNPQYIEQCRQRSKEGYNKADRTGAIEKSKATWLKNRLDPIFNEKMKQSCQTPQFRENVSKAIKEKFKNDSDYVTKICIARKKYWESEEYRNNRKTTTEEFITKAEEIHCNKYDYSLSEYKTSRDKLIIICPDHGQFTQRPSHHIHYKNGCPICAFEIEISKPQMEITKWINTLGKWTIINNENSIGDFELDIFIPEKQLAIEYHGGFWHSYDKLENNNQRTKHQRKKLSASANNINLLQFFDVEWLNKQSIVKSIIINKLGLSSKIHARQCNKVKLERKIADQFFKINHLQGQYTAPFNYGLIYNNQLVSVISLATHSKYDFEIIRFASLLNHSVVGGLSKLLSFAKSDLNASRIFTYSNLRYSNDLAYNNVGFQLLGTTKPNYYYWYNNKLFDRRIFQKHKLSKKLQVFDPQLSEVQNMFNNGYRRIWDAGHFKLLWTK